MSEGTSNDGGTAQTSSGAAASFDPVDQGGQQQGQNQPGETPDGKAAGKVKIQGDFDPERAARALEAARTDATTEKQKRQLAERQRNDVLKALGLDPEGKPDAKALGEQVERERTEARQARVELAVFRAAGKVGGDPDALLDSRAFLDTIADLDPASSGFGDAVAGAIAKAIETNPRLKAAGTQGGGQGAGRGGVPLTGGPEGKTNKPTTLEEALQGRV